MDLDQRGRRLVSIAGEAQRRIVEIIDRMPAQELDRSAFDQAGLRDGGDHVADHVAHGELGLALQHLLYMVKETGISLPRESVQVVLEAAASCGLPTPEIPLDDERG